MYDNIIESPKRYDQSSGFGCILAHSMGLGKTIQVVSFTDIFHRCTSGSYFVMNSITKLICLSTSVLSGKRVLCIVPINTIQNWLSEFNQWLPEDPSESPLRHSGQVRARDFNIHVLNDTLKNLEQRSKVIIQWQKEGGVLLMGYELYRQLANKRPRKRKKKVKGPECIDLEAEDQTKLLLDGRSRFRALIAILSSFIFLLLYFFRSPSRSGRPRA